MILNMGDEFQKVVTTPSDINQHCTVLQSFASRSSHVTEFGVRGGVSTVALLAGLPSKYRGHDINPAPEKLALLAQSVGVDYLHTIGSTLEIPQIEQTDLLFVDTYHTYNQVKGELSRHAAAVQKYLIFHDTVTFGSRGEDGAAGICPAVEEFTAAHPMWRRIYHSEENNGLTILRRMV